ncbi:hypothetical protein AAHY43_18125 [Klebsiella pneumoniae]
MTTDITELALITKIKKQLENFDTVILKEDEALALVEALEKAWRYIEELREWNAGLAQESFERQQRIAELEVQRELAFAASNRWADKLREADRRIAELESFRTAYMEWSDKTYWVQTDKRFDVLTPWGKHRADVLKEYIERLESRTVTVKLPKPHAHLIWIQAGHAPDDYWDDVAVSHSEKDRCCDGSERYPVYARWEIEEMLTAAGIEWEAE